MAATFKLNPERVAYFEAAGWRAYYDHKWLKMLLLIVGLCQEQFRIPFPMSLLAGYYTTRASAAWVPAIHDEQKVLRYLEKFYQVARHYSGLKFDPPHVAVLELQYFETDTNQMRSDGTYFVQGTALLQDGAKPKVNQPMHVISFDDSNQMTDLLSSF